MTLFRYEAVDNTGKIVRGAMNARSEQEVEQKLTGMGYVMRLVLNTASGGRPSSAAVSTGAASAPRPGGSGMQAVTIASGVPVSIKSRVPESALAMFFRQVATLVKSGVPLSQSFADVALVVRDSRLRNAVPQMRDTLSAGQSLSSAMAGFPGLFPAHTIASVWSGELAGTLDIVLDELASSLETEASENRFARLGWGLTKICVIGLIASFPLFNLQAMLDPLLTNVNAKGGSELIKRWLRDSFSTIITKCLPIIVVILVVWVVWGYLKRLPVVRRLIDGALLYVPIWGKLHRYRSLARFFHLMDQLSAAGVSPGVAWNAASIAARNSAIVERLQAAQRESNASTSMTDRAAMSGAFETEDVALIQSGEKTGQAPAVFANLSAMYADKAATQRTMGKMFSVSFWISGQIVVAGIVIIYMASTYTKVLYKLMGF